MRTFLKRIFIAATVGMVTLSVAVFAYYLANRPSLDVRVFQEIEIASANADYELQEAIRQADTGDSKNSAGEAHAEKIRELAQRCLQLAEKYPKTTGELTALIWAACTVPESEAGQKAQDLLEARVATADLSQLGRAFTYSQARLDAIRGLAPLLFDRVQQNPNHPQAAYLLTRVCVLTKGGGEEREPPESFAIAADLIVTKYAHSPEITNFCECLGFWFGSPSWAGSFERHLRTIYEKNGDRRVRCAALFALASVVQSSADDRQVEAENLYRQFLEEFDGEHQYSNQGIERQYNHFAKIQLAEIRIRGIGKPASEIVGVDTNGRSMKLSDYRGKVVLLSFWATWCVPCMKFIPHEQALAARLGGEQFAIVGVNGDNDEQVGQSAVASHKLSWRSFRDRLADKPAISDEWQVISWPTVYLIDRAGVIRRRWTESPSPVELNREVDRLIFGSANDIEVRGTARAKPTVAE